jgi:hypothetical protein
MACAITDGNDLLMTSAPSPTTSFYSQSNPIVNGSAYLLWSLTSSAVTVYVWMNESGKQANDTIPSVAPTNIVQLPYNPFLFCNLQQTFYTFVHSMIPPSQAASPIDFT